MTLEEVLFINELVLTQYTDKVFTAKTCNGLLSEREKKLKFDCSVLDISLVEEKVLESVVPFCFVIG